MSLASFASLALYVALCCYGVATGAYFLHAGSPARGRLLVVATAASVTGLACNLTSIVAKGFVEGRAPWGNMVEFSAVSAAVIVTAYLLVVQVRSHMAVLGGVAHMFAILMIGLGIMVFNVPAGTPLPPALESGWLVFHVFCAIVGSSTLTLAAAISVVLLARARYEAAYASTPAHPERADDVVPDRVDDGVTERVPARAAGPGAAYAAVEPADRVGRFLAVGGYADLRGRVLRLIVPALALVLFATWLTPALPMPRDGVGAVAAIVVSVVAFCGLAWAAAVAFVVWLRDRLPSAAALDRSAYRVVMFGFPVWTLAIMAGAVWGEGAWGRWWGWDPKETWSFIVWVLFAGYLHARATHGWRGQRAALLGTIGGIGLFINFYAVNTILIGLHSYAG